MPYLKKQKGKIILYLIVSIIINVISVFLPIVTSQILIQLTNENFHDLFIIVTIYLLINLVDELLIHFNNNRTSLIFRNILSDIQIDLAKETLNLEIQELDHNGSGVFIERLNNDCNNIANIYQITTNSITDLFSSIGIFLAIFTINKIMFFYFLITTITIFLVKKERNQSHF